MEELDLSFVDDLSVDDLLNVGPDDVDGLELSDGGPPLHEFEELFFRYSSHSSRRGCRFIWRAAATQYSKLLQKQQQLCSIWTK